MIDHHRIEGIAAPLALANLDTDQIMPKQFLRGIDKNGLAAGVFYDMRFDAQGMARDEFVLNRPEYAGSRILVAGPNFGCGSSREHAVWGLQQFGIQAVIAPSFGEIFYSNAMNNRLLLVMLREEEVAALIADVDQPETATIAIDVVGMTVKSATCSASFELAPRHHDMFMKGQDLIGASLVYKRDIDAFAAKHWNRYPWLKDVAGRTRSRLSGND
jgi:3-isopropylmalate/(R)-2-methylmalate dehydratase small subunit